MARRVRTHPDADRLDRARLALRVEWLPRVGLIPPCDPPRPDALTRGVELRRVRDRAAARGASVAEQVAAVEAAMTADELERVDRLLAYLSGLPNYPLPRRTR